MTKRRIRGKVLAVYGQVLVEGLDGWLPDYGRLGLDWTGNLTAPMAHAEKECDLECAQSSAS